MYALPTAVFNRPNSYSEEDILSYLNNFTFSLDKLPATAEIAGKGMTLWAGPRNSYPQMINLVKRQKITKFHTSNMITMSPPPAVLNLIWPDDTNEVTENE